LPGKRTEVWAYRDGAQPGSAGTVPGPRLEAKRGDEVIVHFQNELPEPTTVHWHGLRLPIKQDGSTSSQASIPAGGSYEYRFRVEDSGTFWFHPHVRGYDQIERGLYAPFIVKGDEDIDVTADRTFVVDDVKLQATGELAPDGDPLDMMVGKQGNVLLLNGKRDGTIVVESGGRQRWRFVNSANGRYFTLRLGGHPFTIIGTDGGLLPKVRTVDTLLIAPGERYEVLVTFDDPEGTRATLETLHYDRGHELPDQGARPLAQIVVGPRNDRALRAVPQTLRTIAPLAITASTPMKRFLLQENETGAKDGPTFSINDEAWPLNQPVMVKQNEVEIWEVESPQEMDHPFHLHGMFFQVLGADGQPDTSLGWKDTINVKRGTKLRFAVRYEPLGMWMFHCHILEHAERGMMGDLMVMP
jgi:FtsP/CotA-like multicopper oxidase with cupredoxin domain